MLAGNVMSRRSSYMYGNLLPADPRGQVGAGLGVSTSSGSIGLIPPTDTVSETGQRMNIAGLDFEFMMAPDSEAPAEMHWFIEQFKAVTAAENCCHTLHNTYSIRGTKIRDPLSWSKYLEHTIELWGDRAELMYGMHHWPAWGRERVLELLGMARDGYRFINDETLRLANHGFGPSEIAEQVEFPPELDRHWAMRGYYGTLNHNVKATYVNYLGWFDGNPATLHTLPPEEAAGRYVEFMGGADAALEKAQAAFERGEYRWVAEVVNHLVFADPENKDARSLQANALEQLGYQSESGPWRNFYLTGSQRAAQRGAGPTHPEHRQPRHGPGNEHVPVLRLPGHAAERRQGRRSAQHAGLRACRHRRDVDADAAPRHVESPAGRGPRGRCHAQDQPVRPRRGDPRQRQAGRPPTRREGRYRR